MSIPTWPVNLPVTPLITGYEETLYTGVRHMTAANRAPLIRRNAVLRMRMIKCSFILNQPQLEILEDFVYDTLAGGALRFSFTHPRTKETIECSFHSSGDDSPLYTIGEPRGTKLASDTEQYNIYYEISFNLIVWP